MVFWTGTEVRQQWPAQSDTWEGGDKCEGQNSSSQAGREQTKSRRKKHSAGKYHHCGRRVQAGETT